MSGTAEGVIFTPPTRGDLIEGATLWLFSGSWAHGKGLIPDVIETFIANEQREFTSTDPNKQNLQKCIEMADVVIHNDGTIEELYNQFENFLVQR